MSDSAIFIVLAYLTFSFALGVLVGKMLKSRRRR